MIFEINQIKRHLARKLGLRLEGEGTVNLRIPDYVPDGEHVIPLGRHPAVPYRVKIEAGQIWIGEKA